MKKKTVIIPIVSFLALAGITASVFASNNITEVQAEEGTFVPSSSLKESYKLNDIFTVPNGSVEFGGEKLTVSDYYLTYPNGKSYKSASYSLDVAGRYDCTFIGKKGSKSVYAHYLFNAYSGIYSFSNVESSVAYSEHLPTVRDEVGGLTVSLAENDMFTFNQAVDISNADLSKPVIKYHPHAMSLRANPANAGKNLDKLWEYDDPEKPKPLGMDAKQTVVRMTDAYDPTNYVETYIYYRTANMANNRQQQYAVGGASCQNKIGIAVNTTGKVGSASRIAKIDGVDYSVWIGNRNFGRELGTRSGYIMERRPNTDGSISNHCVGTTLDAGTTADISNADDYGYSIYYEAATQKLYVESCDRRILNDMDESALYNESEKFHGFTTGEVFVSVYALEYNDRVATFDVESIYGITGEDLNAPSAKDDVPPTITLSNDADDFNVAVGETFRLFDANVTDVNYAGEYEVSAYYEKDTFQQVQVPVIDNTITPNKPGTYSIVYKASDTFGNEATKTLTLHAIVTESNKAIDFSVEKVESAPAGATLTLPKHRMVTYNSGYEMSIEAIYKDGTITKVDPSTRELFLKRVGDYKIVYVYGDGIFTYQYEYTLKSTASDNYYLEEVALPKYLIQGAEYTLDQAKIVSCDAEEPSYYEPEVKAIEDGGAAKVIDRKDFATEANESVSFVYSYQGKEIYTSEAIEVVDVNFKNELVRSTYFQGEDVAVSSNDSAILLSPNVGKNGHLDFINPVSFADFSMEFDFGVGAFNCSSFTITLSEFEDPSNTVYFRFFLQYGELKVNVNGIETFAVADNYSLSYNNLSKYIYDSSDCQANMVSPFESDRVYISFDFEGVTGLTSLGLRSIDSQRLSSSGYDDCEPNIISRNLSGLRPLNEKISLDFIYPCDVFSPYLEKNYSMSVSYKESEDAEPSYVTSSDGVLLDGSEEIHRGYEFELNKLGTYEVAYIYTDQAYVDGSLDYAFTSSRLEIIDVTDTVAPTIVLNGGYNTDTVVYAAYGSTYEIQGYTASDNVDQPTVKVYAISPTMQRSLIEEKTLVLNEKGLWTICYTASDSSGNVSAASYRVYVA